MARRLNILLINHYAGTPSLGMEYRPYYLAREWVRTGHRVTVVAANFSHVRARQPQAGQEVVDGITYHWLPTPGYQGNGLGRVKNIWHFLRQVWQRAPALVAACQPDTRYTLFRNTLKQKRLYPAYRFICSRFGEQRDTS